MHLSTWAGTNVAEACTNSLVGAPFDNTVSSESMLYRCSREMAAARMGAGRGCDGFAAIEIWTPLSKYLATSRLRILIAWFVKVDCSELTAYTWVGLRQPT